METITLPSSPRWPRPRVAGAIRVGLLATLALLTVSVQPSGARPSEPAAAAADAVLDEVCLSEACNQTVASLAKTMNLSADPCDDFYEFACGGFSRDTPLPDGEDTVSVISLMEDTVRGQLRDLLAEPSRPAEPATFTKAKALYQSCMNTTRLEELGVEPAKKLLADLGLPAWPLAEGDAWDEAAFDWQNTSFKLMELGLFESHIITFEPMLDVSNTSGYALTVHYPNFLMDLVGLDNTTQQVLVERHLAEITNFGEMLGYHSNLLQDAVQIAVLDIAMNLCTRSQEDRRNVTLGLTKMTLSEMENRFPFVSWLRYAKTILPAGTNITEHETVVVFDPRFLASLGEILRKTPKRVLANYVVWRTLQSKIVPALNEAARNVVRDRERPRWEVCVLRVQESMHVATSAMYVRRHSSEEARRQGLELLQDIGKEMRHLLAAVDWMDPKTRRAALLKAESLHYSVAYPPELLNDTLLDEYFETLEIRPDDLLGNVRAVGRKQFDLTMQKYGTSVPENDWTGTMALSDNVNAYYESDDNRLSVPAGIMQGAFFQKDRPQYMNYAGIGFVFAHEMSHAFDDEGRLFDSQGQMVDWWEAATKDKFNEKVKCIVDLYSGMRDPLVNITVNGVVTQGENIADNAGLKLAYRAYNRYTARHGPEPRTAIRQAVRVAGDQDHQDGDVQTRGARTRVLKPRQMFWVSFASTWCSKQTLAQRNLILRTDEHVPFYHRVNGALSNLAEFAADFKCPVGSRMHREHTCQVW